MGHSHRRPGFAFTALPVEVPPRCAAAARILDDPGPKRHPANEQLDAGFGDLILHPGRYLFEVMTEHQAVNLPASVSIYRRR